MSDNNHLYDKRQEGALKNAKGGTGCLFNATVL